MNKPSLQIDQERLFQVLVESAFETIAIVDEAGVFTYVSPSITRMMGWTPEELVGRPTFDFLPEDLREGARELHESIVARHGCAEHVESVAMHRDGTWRNLEVSIQNLLDDPNVAGVVINYRDITERKRYESMVRESEERYEKAFRSSPDGIVISRIRDGVFLDVNEGFERITGFTREEMIGRSSLDLHHWRHPDDRERLTDELRQNGRVFGFEGEFLDKDGNIHVGQLSVEMIELGGETCMLTTIHDVTELATAERKLEQTMEELRLRHERLIEKHRALHDLLERVQQEKSTYRHDLTSSIDNLLRPLIENLTANNGRLPPAQIEALQSRLDMIMHRDIAGYSENASRLSPREQTICDMIREGMSSRKIAQELGLSPETVNKHRQSIRRKLQIDHQGINLTSYLRSR